MKKSILLILALFTLKNAFTQPGLLDPLFGTKGIVKSDIGSGYNYELIGKQVLTKTDGSIYILLLSEGQTLIAKKRTNGSADSTYGNFGFSDLLGIAPVSAAFEPDGKIVVAGTVASNGGDVGFVLARYNTDGSLDNTFKSNTVPSVNFTIASIAVQKDGKVIAAGTLNDNGSSYFVLSRYNTDGSIDISFSTDGLQTMSFGFAKASDAGGDYPEEDIAHSVAIQEDGKIVIAGEAMNYKNRTRDFAIARFNTDGNLDSTFSSDAKQITDFGSDDYPTSIAFQADGKIIVAGATDVNGSIFNVAIARYNKNGSLDNTFNEDGKQTTNIGSTDLYNNSVAIQADGKIIVQGVAWNGSNNDFAIVRYNTNGSLDNSFDIDGKLTTDFGTADDYSNSIVIQRDGKIVVEGYSYTYSSSTNSGFAVARYNTNGSLDKTFNANGKLTENIHQGYTVYNSTAIQKDGKIIAAGYSWNGRNNNFLVARYNAGGSLDSTFNVNGKIITDFASTDCYINSVAIQNDGKIVVAGEIWNGSNNDFALARYNVDGSLDKTFDLDGKLITDFSATDDFARAVAIQSDGKIVVAGYSTIGAENTVDFVVVRYNTNGSLDNTFSGDGKQATDINSSSNDFAYSIAIQTNGKIVVGGYTGTGSENITDFALVRYNADGSLDNTFDVDGKQTTDFGYSDDYINSIAIQTDGKIVAGGRSGNYGTYKYALSRYNSDGSLDLSFANRGLQTTGYGYSDAYANSIAIQSDGKIVAGGSSNDNFAIARFNNNGSKDSTFNSNGIQITYASAGEDRIQGIAIQNNKLYAVGYGQYPGDFGVVAKYSLNKSPLPPSVSITSPANDTTFAAPATIKINATASDPDGTITNVKFYNGTTYLKTVFSRPYTYTLSNLPTGIYSITAKATDNTGLQTTSAPLRVVVNKAPIVSIIKPFNNTTFAPFATIKISAAATDIDGTISKVEFYNGTTLLHTETVAPYGLTWKRVPAGTYSITVKATDNLGSQAISAPVTILVSKGSVVSITSPFNNAVYSSPATIKLSAIASDSIGNISSVKFYNGSTLLHTETEAPYGFMWKNVAPGIYSITAIAINNQGIQTISAPIKVTVTAPVLPIVANRVSSSISLIEANNNVSLQISPNPATNILNVNTNGLIPNKKLTISIISASGIVMQTRSSTTSTNVVQLNISPLIKGVYILKVVSGDKVFLKQFVKM